MKTIADLKRAVIRGVRLELVKYTVNGVERPHPSTGALRCVVHTQGDAFCLAPDMEAPRSKWAWADWPKVGTLTFEPDDSGFTITRSGFALTYKFRGSE